VLKPALATPPAEMAGAVGDIAATEKVTRLERPVADTDTVTVPAVFLKVTIALAVPSFNVMAGDGLTVAAPAGFTVKLTITPGTAAPLLLATFTTSGAASVAPVLPLWLLPLKILRVAGLTTWGVSLRTRSLIESVT
jgi:hypothetical protein